MCDLEQERTADQFDWRLMRESTPSKHTGPDYAYNGDYYIYIEASRQVMGDDAM